jgi:hypothetical protein
MASGNLAGERGGSAMSWMLSFALRVAVAFVLLTAFQVAALSFPERSFAIGVLAGIFLPVIELMLGKGKQL